MVFKTATRRLRRRWSLLTTASELLDSSWILRYHSGSGSSARPSMGSLQKATMKHVVNSFDPLAFLATVGTARTITQCQKDHTIFSAGEADDACFYLKKRGANVAYNSEQAEEGGLVRLT